MQIFKPVDDSKSVEHNQVEEIVRTLCVSYSQFRCSFFKTESAIHDALAKKDITEVVRIMMECYRIPKGLLKRIGYSAKIQTAASVRVSIDAHSQRVVSCTMYFENNKQELCSISNYLLFHIIAHELAHVRMIFDLHRLRNSEFSTDVLAVLVTGNRKDYIDTMIGGPYQYHGYIRGELVPEIFTCLEKYSNVIYLK